MIILNKKRNKGFVALMSAIIISVILLLIITNLSLTAFYSRSDVLDSELKDRSSALAEACVDTAILKLVNNSNYSPVNECVPVGDICPNTNPNANICTIVSVDSGNHIKTQAKFNNSYTNFRIVVDANTFAVQSWEECANITNNPNGC